MFLATHHGLYLVAPDGSAQLVSVTEDDFMGFTPHPKDPSVLFSSGHPAAGGNLGFLRSSDTGVTWEKLSDGGRGPVDFHQMDVSEADPDVIFGAYAAQIHTSRDGGRTWEVVAPAPGGLIDLAASGQNPRVLYAGTELGLFRSADGGKTWHQFPQIRETVTMVEVADAELYVFVLGRGLLKAAESGLAQWETLADGFGERAFLHLAVGELVLYAVTVGGGAQQLVVSHDGGRTRTPLE